MQFASRYEDFTLPDECLTEVLDKTGEAQFDAAEARAQRWLLASSPKHASRIIAVESLDFPTSSVLAIELQPSTTLHVSVTHSDDSPITHAKVTLLSPWGWESRTRLEEENPVRRLLAPSGDTGDDGHATLEVPPAHALALEVTKFGYAPVRRPITPSEQHAGSAKVVLQEVMIAAARVRGKLARLGPVNRPRGPNTLEWTTAARELEAELRSRFAPPHDELCFYYRFRSPGESNTARLPYEDLLGNTGEARLTYVPAREASAAIITTIHGSMPEDLAVCLLQFRSEAGDERSCPFEWWAVGRDNASRFAHPDPLSDDGLFRLVGVPGQYIIRFESSWVQRAVARVETFSGEVTLATTGRPSTYDVLVPSIPSATLDLSVTDPHGNPLDQVSVSVAGSRNGVHARHEFLTPERSDVGELQLYPEAATLYFTAFGYATTQRDVTLVNGRNRVTVQLQPVRESAQFKLGWSP